MHAHITVPSFAAHRQHPVEGALHGGPQMIDEGAVPRAEPVVPDAGGDVRAHVGVELGLLDVPSGEVVVPPTAVVALDVDQPLVAAFGCGVETGDVERHGGLDVVPRVAVAAGEPRDHPGVELQRGDPFGGLRRPRRPEIAPSMSGNCGMSRRPFPSRPSAFWA